MQNKPKKFDYKNRIKGAFEAMLIMIDNNKPDLRKSLGRMIKAQLKNLDGVTNK